MEAILCEEPFLQTDSSLTMPSDPHDWLSLTLPPEVRLRALVRLKSFPYPFLAPFWDREGGRRRSQEVGGKTLHPLEPTCRGGISMARET